jgi:HK97 family phage major capsid protein
MKKNTTIPAGAVEGVHYHRVNGRVFPVVSGGDGPMTKTLLEAEKLKRVKSAEEIAAKAQRERGENASLTEDERTQIMALVTEAKGYHDQILALDGDAKLRSELSILGSPSGAIAAGDAARPSKGQTLGEKFVNSDEFSGWLKSVAPEGHIREKTRLDSPAVAFGQKDLITGSSVTSAGALVQSEWLGLLDGLAQFQRPLTIMDLITRGTTGSDQVEYARVTGFTNNAAPVAEALTDLAVGAAAGGSIGTVDSTEAGIKPKSGLALEKKTANVKTIAHWLPATTRSLSDAGQIRTLIDQFLRYGLDEELEDQIMTGDDSGENFEGILEVSGTQAQAWDTDLLTTTRKARTKVRTVGRAQATAFVFHPNDNERIDLLKNSNGDFYFGGPTSNPSAPLWGLPRVESEAMTEGTGMVADWRQAVLWDREQAGIAVSNSHADFFTRNLVAILAEMRAAFGVIRPKAFVTIDLTA